MKAIVSGAGASDICPTSRSSTSCLFTQRFAPQARDMPCRFDVRCALASDALDSMAFSHELCHAERCRLLAGEPQAFADFLHPATRQYRGIEYGRSG